MDMFQYPPPRDHSYIESLHIREQLIPPRNPNINPNDPTRHSSSSSSSSSHGQPLQLGFLVNFTIHDSPRLPVPYLQSLPLLSQPLTTSSTLSLDPNLNSSWSWVRLELDRIGLDARFIEPVVNVLQTRVYAIVSGFNARRYGYYGQASVKLQVNIKRRLTMVPIRPVPRLPMVTIHPVPRLPMAPIRPVPRLPMVPLRPVPRLPMVPIRHVQRATAPPPPPGPLDHHHHHHHHDDNHDGEERNEMLAMETLEIVKAEDEEAFIKDASCAICLEDFQVVAMEEKKVKGVPMKLPCKHVFHDGCIRRWFKKSHFCPLCRSDVLARNCH